MHFSILQVPKNKLQQFHIIHLFSFHQFATRNISRLSLAGAYDAIACDVNHSELSKILQQPPASLERLLFLSLRLLFCYWMLKTDTGSTVKIQFFFFVAKKFCTSYIFTLNTVFWRSYPVLLFLIKKDDKQAASPVNQWVMFCQLMAKREAKSEVNKTATMRSKNGTHLRLRINTGFDRLE